MNDLGSFIPAIIGIAIGIWMLFKKNRQIIRCTAKTAGIITGEQEKVTEGLRRDYNPEIHGSDTYDSRNRVRETTWQAIYRFEINGQSYEAAAKKYATRRFQTSDTVTVN